MRVVLLAVFLMFSSHVFSDENQLQVAVAKSPTVQEALYKIYFMLKEVGYMRWIAPWWLDYDKVRKSCICCRICHNGMASSDFFSELIYADKFEQIPIVKKLWYKAPVSKIQVYMVHYANKYQFECFACHKLGDWYVPDPSQTDIKIIGREIDQEEIREKYINFKQILYLFFIAPWWLDFDKCNNVWAYCNVCQRPMNVMTLWGDLARQENTNDLAKLKNLLYKGSTAKVQELMTRYLNNHQIACSDCQSYGGWHER